MGIVAHIIEINIESKTCIIKIYDDEDIVLDTKNIGLELNQDGTANMDWVTEKIKEQVFSYRENNRSEMTNIQIS